MSLNGNAKAKQKVVGKINGLKTIHGKSAYEIAVINGFSGTEKEWLESLKGDKGDKGDKGQDAVANRLLEYTIENNQVIITGYREDSFPSNYTLPSYIEGYPVTEIRHLAFYTCSTIEHITISEGLQIIGEVAFSDMYNLTSITIPYSVHSIGRAIFSDSEKITDIYYMGTEKQWKAISFGDYNDNLNGINIHYNQSNVTKNYVDNIVGDLETLLGGI